jgi:hypothetical protein
MFEDKVEFMTDDLVSNFRSGTIYFYVGSTFLNGYINYIKPIKIYLLERYRTQGKTYEEKIWFPFITDPPYHTNLNDLHDDILILGETENHYYFFWYDCDCSDCAIGRQKKNEIIKEEAVKWFDNYTESLVEPRFVEYRNQHREQFDTSDDECAEGITGYREIPTKCLRGRVKF